MNRGSHPPPAYLPSSIQEALTRQFYDWEIRGRGWFLWDNPVGLEPPFLPFLRLPDLCPPLPGADDGQREDFFSSIITGLQRLLSGSRRSRDEDLEEDQAEALAEPDVEIARDDSPILEFEVALPALLKVSHTFASQFLIALTYCKKPLSFEIIGVHEGITVQLACHEEDQYPLREQLAAYFPEATVLEREGHLARSWNGPDPKASVLVDFALAHEFVRPLKSYGGFDADPLIPIVGALSNLQQGELGMLQILFTPARMPWAESILQSVSNSEGKPLFANATEMVALARQKISQPLYAVVLRAAAQSPSEDRAWGIVKALGGALAQFGDPTGNELAPLHNRDYPEESHERDLVERRSHRTGMLLNSEELVSLVHLPSASVRSPKLKRQSTKTKAAPALALGHELVLGENEHEGRNRTVTLSADQRVRHAYVIGATGTGKSTFLLNMILQDLEQGNGLAVLDPHGDLIDQILERVPEKRYGDVILLDPSDGEYPIGFNILSAHSETEKHLLASDLVSVFRRLSTSWGDQMTSVLGNAVLSFLESERGGTLRDLRRFLVEKEYRMEFLKTVKDAENVYYWQKEFPLLAGKPQAPLLTRLDTFLRPKLIRHMVAQRENKLDFAEIMNTGKIFLAKLAQGAIGEENAYLLGTLLVSKFHQLTLARQELKASDRRPFYLYMDEFHNFTTPSMASILTGARKYRLGLVMAHQELRQLGVGSEIASTVLSSPFTRVCFRVGDQDAAKLADGFSFFEAKDLQNLGTGEAVCRMERAEYDFNLKTSTLDAVDRALAKERLALITQLSRQRYGTRRDLVEAELARDAPELGSTEQQKPAAKTKEKKEPSGATQPESARKQEASGAGQSPPTESKVPPDSMARDEKPLPSPPWTGEATVAYERSAPSQPKPKPIPPEPPTPGRGGREHKHLQRLIKQWAEGMGWKATIEQPILAGAGSVDVALEKEGQIIACEIGVTTPVEKEIGNLEKCVKAGIGRIVSVSTDPKHLKKIEDAAKKKLSAEDMEKVRFLNPDRLFEMIEEIDARLASGERRSKGIKVKVEFRPSDKVAKQAKRRDLHESVVESIEELRKAKESKKRGA